MARRPREFTEAEIEGIVELHEANLSTTAIAEQIGCAHTTVQRVLAEQGIDWQQPANLKPITAAQYREGYDAGYRTALCHVHLHGLEGAHEYSRYRQLPWAKNGDGGVPPDFPGMYAKRENARNRGD